ncbi:TPA: Mu transposase C-terminal domain-containing protein [Pseudomonas aeruginosa]|nr:Mu transposase C-terminal domain-containing protein [Pseudomonas aeruginosa]HCJ6265379.1 Mu transposase C-terminal domain-containing protein [Pseudomonas aeruginosa]
MHANELTVGQPLFWREIPYCVKAIPLSLREIVLEGKGGVEQRLDFPAFYNAVASGEIRLPTGRIEVSQRAWRSSELAEAQFRLDLLDTQGQLHRQQLSPAAIHLALTDFCQQRGRRLPCANTIKAYETAYKAAGFNGLIPNFARRGGSGWRKKNDAKVVAEQFLVKEFMTDDKLNLTRITERINRELGEASLSRKTVTRELSLLSKSLVKEGRIDQRTFNLLNRQAVQRYNVTQPFERVELDAKTLDLYCVDEAGERYTQLTLYAMVCAYASYPLAIYVCAGKPSQYTLLKVLEFFFTPKDEDFKKRFDLQYGWLEPCAISTLVVDNASENFSDLALNLVRRLGIDITYARSRRGDDKPHVESFFRALDARLIELMPGTTKSQDKRIKNRHERAAKEACYTVEEIYRFIVKFVAEVYIHQPRPKLGFRHGKTMSIQMAMDKALEQFMPAPPPPLQAVKRLVLDMHRERRVVQHYGVDFEGFQFHSNAFAALASERTLQSVEILFNPEDCREIYAVHPDDDTLIPLLNKTTGIPAVSFATAKALKKQYADARKLKGPDYLRALAELQEQFINDSRRRPKIRENNQKLRAQERKGLGRDVAEQLQPQLPPCQPPVQSVDEPQLPIQPARRREVKREE